MTRVSGIGQRSAQKPWACTRSRLTFADRLADVRSAVPSKSFGVDVRMVQPVDRVERVGRRKPKPARRTGRERDAGPGARRRERARSRRVGRRWGELRVTRRADSPGTYDFDWISHLASYGFTIGANFEFRPGQAELTEEIHHFLADVDPKTGYLPD
jgi:hypothetical protein